MKTHKYTTMNILRIAFGLTLFSWALLFLVASASAEPLFKSQTKKPQDKKLVLVEKVISADTIMLADKKRIRLIGLSAPEAPRSKQKEVDQYGIIIKETDPTITLNQRAVDFTRQLLENKAVRLEYDVQLRDSRDNYVAYVFLSDGTLANAEIIRQGYAHLKISPPNTKYADLLRDAYREAKRELRGLQGE